MLDRTNTIAQMPNTTKDTLGIQVKLEHAQLGTYHSKPAHLNLLRVTLSPRRDFLEACLEIRLSSARGPRTKSEADDHPFIGVYGPAHIVEASEHARANHLRPASVQMSPSKGGILMIVRAREGAMDMFPSIIYVGLVVVHAHAAQYTILPSTTDYQRAKAWHRTVVRPVNLDLVGALGRPKVTCALQAEGGCHPTCKDFGEGHMTPNIWKGLFELGDARFYEEASPDVSSHLRMYLFAAHNRQNWVKYV